MGKIHGQEGIDEGDRYQRAYEQRAANCKDPSPVTTMALDKLVFWVNADTPY